jgi:recombination protein RecT
MANIQVSNNANTLKNIIASVKNRFQNISVNDPNKYNREANFAMQAILANQFTLDCALKNPDSVANAIINIASLRTTLNPAEKKAYLVPYSGKNPRIDLQISYMGLIDLAITDGAIMWAKSEIVYSNDDFILTGLDTQPIHKFNPFAKKENRGEVVGVYCVAKMQSGDYITETMSVEEVESIKMRSSAVKSGKSSPWDTDYNEMAKKTVIKRASKLWKGSKTLSNAIQYLNDDCGEGIIIDQDKQQNSVSESRNQNFHRDFIEIIKEKCKETDINPTDFAGFMDFKSFQTVEEWQHVVDNFDQYKTDYIKAIVSDEE